MGEVKIQMDDKDIEWMEETYGKDWIKRLEQHIDNEIHLRRRDGEKLRMRKPWDY